MRLVLVVGLVLVLAGGAAGQVTVKGDAKAWQDVIAAQDKLSKLKTYRVKMTVEGQPAVMITEHVSPGRTRTVMTIEGMTLETIVVDGKSASRRTVGGQTSNWSCSEPQAGPQAPADPKSAKGEVTVRRIGEAAIGGTSTSGYEFTWVQQGQAITQRMYIARDGLPRRLVVLDGSGKPQTTMDYYDFGAPITIEPPRCG